VDIGVEQGMSMGEVWASLGAFVALPAFHAMPAAIREEVLGTGLVVPHPPE
jgi:hypothetical protein